jgi:tyrosine-specific transport protein
MRTLRASILLAGNIIGMASFGIPFASGISGFIPGAVMTFVIGVIIYFTSLLYAEAVLALPDGANISSSAGYFLGRWAQISGTAILISLNLVVLSGYLSQASQALIDLFSEAFHFHPSYLAVVFFIFFAFFFILFRGVLFSEKVNFFLFMCLLAALGLIVFIGSREISLDWLKRTDWSLALFAAPILYTAFGFQVLVPTLTTYLERDPKKIKKALFWGTFIPFVIFVTIQWLIIGKYSPDTLWLISEKTNIITWSYELLKKTPWMLYPIISYFFIAILTSYIGISLGLIDAWADFFKIPLTNRRGWRRVILCLLTLVPGIVLFFIAEETTILNWLSYGSGIGEIILSFFPVAMVFIARYRLDMRATRMLGGGKFLLYVLLLISFYMIWFQGVYMVQFY